MVMAERDATGHVYLSASHWSRKGNEPGAAPRNSSLNQILLGRSKIIPPQPGIDRGHAMRIP